MPGSARRLAAMLRDCVFDRCFRTTTSVRASFGRVSDAVTIRGNGSCGNNRSRRQLGKAGAVNPAWNCGLGKNVGAETARMCKGRTSSMASSISASANLCSIALIRLLMRVPLVAVPGIGSPKLFLSRDIHMRAAVSYELSSCAGAGFVAHHAGQRLG